MNKFIKGLVIVGLVGIVGVASANLIQTFVTITGNNDVQQAVVLLDGETEVTFTGGTIYGGETSIETVTIENRSSVNMPITISTTTIPGITTTYWSTVDLTSKDSNWQPTTDMSASLRYQLISEAFTYELSATGLEADTNYSLIYYADMPNRFEDWGGDNPGRFIGSFDADVDGNLDVATTKNLNINLATGADANLEEYDYCLAGGEDEDYDLCHGAKIWLVETDNYNKVNKEVTTWDPSMFLFETDLMTYSDTDVDGATLNLGTGKLTFTIESVLANNLVGPIELITTVNPL